MMRIKEEGEREVESDFQKRKVEGKKPTSRDRSSARRSCLFVPPAKRDQFQLGVSP